MTTDDEYRLAIGLLRDTIGALTLATERLGLVMQTLARLGPQAKDAKELRSDFDYMTGTLPKS